MSGQAATENTPISAALHGIAERAAGVRYNDSVSALRGRVVWPLGPQSAVLLEDGVVARDLTAPRPARPGDPDPVHGVIVPAFADWHVHWVQIGIAGRARSELLPWLRDVAWPEEERLLDDAVSRAEAAAAAAALRRAGTLAGAVYAGPRAASAAHFLGASPPGFLCGPAVMTAGDPPALTQSIDAALTGLRALHARFGPRVVVAPRFALSSTPEGLAALGALAVELGLAVQTHLAENENEIREVTRRYPRARDYTDVYARAGLLGARTLLGHAIHVGDDALGRIAEARTVVAHCPTSNAALGSGRMPLERLRGAGVRWVLGSDVGAGPHLCMLDVVASALDAHAGHAELTATEAWHRATIGPARIFAGGSERDQPCCGARPGLLLVDEPPGGPDARTASDWMDRWLARWRGGGGHGIRSTLAWDDVQPGASCG